MGPRSRYHHRRSVVGKVRSVRESQRNPRRTLGEGPETDAYPDLEGETVKFVPILVAVFGVALGVVAIIAGAIALGARTIRRSRR